MSTIFGSTKTPQEKPFYGLAADWSCFAHAFGFPLIRLRRLQFRRLRFVFFK
jgi:hypothetical protein